MADEDKVENLKNLREAVFSQRCAKRLKVSDRKKGNQCCTSATRQLEEIKKNLAAAIKNKRHVIKETAAETKYSRVHSLVVVQTT